MIFNIKSDADHLKTIYENQNFSFIKLRLIICIKIIFFKNNRILQIHLHFYKKIKK